MSADSGTRMNARGMFALRRDPPLQILRRVWRTVTCRHVRTMTFYPARAATYWLRDGVSKGEHETILLEGCLGCGRIVVRDYGE